MECTKFMGKIKHGRASGKGRHGKRKTQNTGNGG